MQEFITFGVLMAVAVGSFTDIRKREVPDWLNYSLIIFGLGANALLSLALWTWSYFVYSLVGLFVFFLIAYVMFYTGQWGGGDSKMLIGLGAAFGLPVYFTSPYFGFDSLMVRFWFNLLLAGLVYALCWSFFLVFQNRKKFVREMRFSLAGRVLQRKLLLLFAGSSVVVILLVSSELVRLSLAALVLVVALSFYLSVFSKTVERVGMLRQVSPLALTEGDWIAQDIIIGKRRIAGPRDLGISKGQIAQLCALYRKRKVRKVLIKVGMPFVPTFLIALVMTILFGNVLLRLVGSI